MRIENVASHGQFHLLTELFGFKEQFLGINMSAVVVSNMLLHIIQVLMYGSQLIEHIIIIVVLPILVTTMGNM